MLAWAWGQGWLHGQEVSQRHVWNMTDLEEVCQLGVAVGHMGLLGPQGSEDVPQAGEGLVDAAGLLLVLAFYLAAG